MLLVWRLLVVSVVMVTGWNGTDLDHHIDALAKSSSCICFDSKHAEFNKECRCFGQLFTHVPTNLTQDMEILTITNAGIETLGGDSLQPYRQLREFTVMQVNKLKTLEHGLFKNLIHLRTIYIYSAPSLVEILPALFEVSLPQLKILRIMNTGLNIIPDLSGLTTGTALVMVDLENNQIDQLTSNSVKLRAESLVLNYNKIKKIEGWTFNDSQIAKVSLKGNTELTQLYENSFSGLQSLRYLDLSETSISFLPTDGLQELDILKIEQTQTLKVFPSVYKFKFIREVFLTHACHCCAFKFPQKHNSDEHFKHQEQLRKCDEQEMIGERDVARSKRSWENELWSVENHTVIQQVWGDFQSVAPLAVQTTFPALDPVGVFHPSGVTLSPGRIHALCGNLSKNYQQVVCHPAPDAFNPCEDLMGHWGLRVAVWVVAILALVGNIAVILVLLSSRFRFTVPKFLICNLAMADFCMGLYLLLLAVMDVRSIGDYFNYAIDWQYGKGCSIAGFLTVLSSELSIFTLAVITVERWYTITYAIHLNRRLRLSTAVRIMVLGWIYSITMALFPLMGVSSYSKTSICLPLENVSTVDYSYLTTLLLFNGLAFTVICACYGRMYCSIRGGQDAAATLTRADLTVAKRMALLVFTDFACWAPIAFFGITALAGYPLIDVSKTKILLVFFYPLNSCANPYLYALLTQQYRRDLFVLLSRHGLCARTAARYKGTGVIQRGGTSHAAQRRVDQRPDSANHRGSLLTTVTSMDCATRPGSLDMVPECPLSSLSREQSEHTLVLNKSSSYL